MLGVALGALDITESSLPAAFSTFGHSEFHWGSKSHGGRGWEVGGGEGLMSSKSQTPTESECGLGFGVRVASRVFILPAIFLRASDSTFFTIL